MAAHAMAEQRLFVANDLDAAREMTLSHAQTHYLLHVLRLSEGAHLLVFDGGMENGARKSWLQKRAVASSA